jgi:hypothetical protein
MIDAPADWPFDQAPNVAAITTVRVLDDIFRSCASRITRTMILGRLSVVQPTKSQMVG